MLPETFATEPKSHVKILKNQPARGWITEQYDKARVLLPPPNSGNQIAIIAEDMGLMKIWDLAFTEIAKTIHTHERSEHG